MSADFEKKHYGDSAFAQSSFSEIVTVKGPGRLLFLAGIGAEDTDDAAGGVRHAGDAYGQSRYAFEKATRLLAKHGAAMSDIVKITAYLVDVRDRPYYQAARKEALANVAALPAHTLLVVSNLARPGMMVEIDIVAATPA
jgi:enamine deaminase RidA (YjgF/YER057c/UK114 family)